MSVRCCPFKGLMISSVLVTISSSSRTSFSLSSTKLLSGSAVTPATGNAGLEYHRALIKRKLHQIAERQALTCLIIVKYLIMFV
jgi:hypothetical protein